MIAQPLYQPLIKSLVAYWPIGSVGISGDAGTPDPGFVFVYDHNDRQILDHLNRAVQVPEEFANS